MPRIPRFSPSLRPREAVLAARALLREDPQAVPRFEREFARVVGARHAVMVPSARYGFLLLLRALGVGEGDEVVVPALTYFAIPAMPPLLGARPVFADVGARTHVLDPEAFRAAITPRTRVVVPTHLYGTPCDMDAICAIAEEHGIAVVEDCAQSTGARFRGRPVGGIGGHAYFTFGLTKNMTTLSGGVVATNDDEVARRVRAELEGAGPVPRRKLAKEAAMGVAMFVATHRAVYPWALHPLIELGNRLGKDPIHEPFGEPEHRWDRVPDSLRRRARARAAQAAVGLSQLARLDALNAARARAGRRLDELLAHVPGLETPEYPDGAEPIYMSYVVHHERRDDLARLLRRRGVDTTTGYMGNMADHPLFPEFRADCPNAARAHARSLHLPVHPNLRPADVDHVAEAVRAACLELARG